MNETIIGIIAGVVSIILGVFKFISYKIKQENKKIEEAEKLITEGINERDSSKITSGFTRLRNNK